MSLNIGNINLKHGIMLAPMAGFSDRAMRLVCHIHGAEYSVSEMVSAKAVVYGDKKTAALSRIMADEGRVALQLFGSEPEIMARAVELLLKRPLSAGEAMPCAIDINMGCPVNKIYSNGEGSALMKSPALIEKIVSAVRAVTTLPLSVKLRLGIDRSSINVTDCAMAAEAGGADFITVHGRTRTDMYSGKCDYSAIRDVKRALKIPVIANGDITDGEGALYVLDYTDCDGIMIGRAAIGNPFIFREITAALQGVSLPMPTLAERQDTALFQLKCACLEKGERVAVHEARKQIALYFKGERGSAALRAGINSAESYEEIAALIYSLS